MNNKVQYYRNKLGLTQSELAQKSGLSLRTIQRIESGLEPKGFTLKSIAKALEIESTDLFEENINDSGVDIAQAKLINIASLAYWVLPFGNIIVPSILIYKQSGSVTRKIGLNMLSIQILWTLLTSALLLLSPAIQVRLATTVPIIFVVLFSMFCLNAFIIIRNAIELNRSGKPYILLKYSLL